MNSKKEMIRRSCHYKKAVIQAAVLLFFIFSLQTATPASAAWQNPTANPPSNNSADPVNIANTAQNKQGTMWISSGNAYLSNPNTYGFIVQNGRVGIGSTTPWNLLSVDSAPGTVVANFGGGRIVGLSEMPINASEAVSRYYVDSLVGGGMPSPGANGNTIRSNGTSWLANNNLYNNGTNVGIGNTSPGALLHVGGNGTLAGTQTWSNAANTVQGNLTFDTGNNLVLFGGITANTGLQLVSGNSVRMTVRGSDGNVGIGTSNPQGRLQVVGPSGWDTSVQLHVTNGATDYGRTNLILTGRFQAANDAWSFGSGARNSIVFAQNAAASGVNVGAVGTEQYSIQVEGNTNAMGFMSRTNGSTPNMILLQNGNIGLGTNNPASKLEVSGLSMLNNPAGNNYNENIRLSAASNGYSSVILGAVAGTSGTGVGQWSLVRYPSTSNYLFGIRYDSADFFNITNGGNVGIGTSNPGAYRLYVNGHTYVSGSIEASGADLAEEFAIDDDYSAGTVLVMADSDFYKSSRACEKEYDNMVVGVISDMASVIIGRIDAPKKATVAMIGVVDVKVNDSNGLIKKGDLLTTSAIKGEAMKAINPPAGTVIGKALENLKGNRGKIKVLVNLQ